VVSNRIQKFSSTGSFLATWGALGTGNGQFNSPSGVATDSSGNVYVADTLNNRIQKFSSTGTFITTWGALGTGDGQFNSPSGAATDSSGNVYVADAGNTRIQKFTSTGTFITKWGSAGTGDGQFGVGSTLDVTTGAAGNVIVSDPGNNRIQKFRPIGTFITKWGSAGTADGQFGGASPSGVATDSSDRVYAVDRGNSRIQRFHETDATPPDTQIDSAPSDPSVVNVSFAFSSPDSSLLNPGFECRLDSGEWVACSSPKNYSSLSEGSRTFQVRAVDAAGNPDPSASSYTWTVDGTPPDTTTGGPSGPTNDATPTFNFSSSQAGSSFECRFDSDSFAPCSGPGATHTPSTPLSDGFHTFQVQATDPAGNTDPSPDSTSFTVDTAPPDTTILTGPSEMTTDPTPAFSFSSSEAGSTFQCKVDAGSYASCTSPNTTSRLADGSHAFSVRATDPAGNLDQTPASRVFTVRTAAVSVSGSTLVVTAAPGVKDNLAITAPSASVLRVTDVPAGTYTGSGVHTGAGCTPSGDYTANCSAAGTSLIRVSSQDQNDKVVNSTTVQSSLDGGAENDTLTGGSDNDTLTGGTGADVMRGMNGNDQLLGRDSTDDTTINCDGGTTPGTADRAIVDPLPNDAPASGCEAVNRPQPYVALGDSLSVGLYASSPARSFVQLLYSDYRASLGATQLFNEAEPGEDSGSLLNGGQLQRALTDINAGSDTRVVTIEIGAIDALFRGCAGHWDQPGICPFRTNYRSILSQLRLALQRDPGSERFITMAYYNPPNAANAGSYADRDRALLGNNLAVRCVDTGASLGLNDVIFQEAGRAGVAIANPYQAFKQHGQAYMASGDPMRIHPNDAGYAAIAQSFRGAKFACGPPPG
jgi:lysophospholipase L1-like esterase